MDQKKGVVRGICISKKRGTAKYPVESARIVPDWGIEEDAHGGKWHRQISLLALEKIEAFREQGADVDFGAFGENLIIEGFDLRNVPVDSEIRIGDTVRLKVTQIGKECHSHCAIYRRMGDCIMPREGIFAEVLEGGNICVGDSCQLFIINDTFICFADRCLDLFNVKGVFHSASFDNFHIFVLLSYLINNFHYSFNCKKLFVRAVFQRLLPRFIIYNILCSCQYV